MLSLLIKVLYNPKAFFTHAALLDQACAHCPIFPTAASRRSLGRVSVPMWLIILSDQLAIVALVGLYPTNQLIAHRFVQPREVLRAPAFSRRTYAVLVPVSRGYPPRLGRSRCITHPSATRHQPSKLGHAAVRLACVRHAASVQSEPGSNSSLKFSIDRSRPIFLKRDPNLRNSLLTFFGWDALHCLDRSATRQRKASTQFTCAHCQRSAPDPEGPPETFRRR